MIASHTSQLPELLLVQTGLCCRLYIKTDFNKLFSNTFTDRRKLIIGAISEISYKLCLIKYELDIHVYVYFRLLVLCERNLQISCLYEPLIFQTMNFVRSNSLRLNNQFAKIKELENLIL